MNIPTTMFYNNTNLKKSILSFIQRANDLTIFAPYIKYETLQELLSHTNYCKYIVVRWEPKDLQEGASDLEVYELCKQKGITLYRNNRLHLKLFVEETTAILTTANLSKRAISNAETENYNYELGTLEELTFEDRLYLENIVTESQLIDDNLYEEIQKQLETDEIPKDFHFETKPNHKDFLLSALPMTESIETLIHYYKNKYAPNITELECLIHDLSTYKIQPGLKEEEFIQRLTENFFKHPFISAFVKEIDIQKEMYFGTVRKWIANHCSNVPLPRPYEVTKNVQILYHWIETLSNGKYKVDVPGSHSERIRKNLEIFRT
jgi:hypothetical protein